MNSNEKVTFTDDDAINEFIRLNNLNDYNVALGEHKEKIIIVSGKFAGEYDPYEILVHMKLKDELGKKFIKIHKDYLEWKAKEG